MKLRPVSLGADAARAVLQIRAAVEALEETVQGARIGRLELAILEGGILEAPFAVSGNQLVTVTDAGTLVERIAGNEEISDPENPLRMRSE